MSTDLSSYAAVLLDLDGTIYHDEHPLPGAVELIRKLQARGQKFACLSNSTSSPYRIMGRLKRMGLDVNQDHIYTAAAAACDFVLTRMPRRGVAARVFNLSTEAVGEILEGKVEWVHSGGEPCDGIIIGTPTNLGATEPRQRIALQLARKGAMLIGICADRVYPSPRGIEFGAGALSAMLAYASNSQPVFCGKPQKLFFDELCTRLGVEPNKCVLIGDNVEADVMGAQALGMATILTLTGVTRRRDLLSVPKEQKPGAIIEDLRELL